VRSINAHIASRAGKGKRKVYEAEPWLLASPLDSLIGGYRTDPFNMLPINATRDVLRAFDYCELSHYGITTLCQAALIVLDTQVYVPLSLRMGSMSMPQARTYMFNILHDSMFCSSLISRMLIMQNIHLEQSKRITPVILYHSNNAINQLRQRLLSSEDMCSDIVIMTISSQAVLQVGRGYLCGRTI
jgi:hypothetical protein